jgi:hypothetical protein
MKRLAVRMSLVTLCLSLFAAACVETQIYGRPGRMPYDRSDRPRPDRDHVASPPPAIPSSRAQSPAARLATPSRATVTPGVPTKEFILPARPRRAPGYESTFDLNVVSSLVALNRGELTQGGPLAGFVASSSRRGSDTFYVIPGCYLGNLPPRDGSVPPGCDLKKAKTIK